MGFFFKQIYKFNTDNKKIINLIETYNKNIYIEAINGNSINGVAKGAHLGQLLAQSKVEGEVTIHCSTMSPASTVDIMPAYKGSSIEASVKSQPSEEDKRVVDVARQSVDFYLKAKIPQNNSGIKYGIAYTVPEFKLQNEEQAILLLDRIYNDYKNLSPYTMRAFLVEGLDAILFQYHSDPFLIFYNGPNNNAALSAFYYDLDVEDGFVNVIGDPGFAVVHGGLNALFQDWKTRNYDGPLFSSERFKILYNTEMERLRVAQEEKEKPYNIESSEPEVVQFHPEEMEDPKPGLKMDYSPDIYTMDKGSLIKMDTMPLQPQVYNPNSVKQAQTMKTTSLATSVKIEKMENNSSKSASDPQPANSPEDNSLVRLMPVASISQPSTLFHQKKKAKEPINQKVKRKSCTIL